MQSQQSSALQTFVIQANPPTHPSIRKNRPLQSLFTASPPLLSVPIPKTPPCELKKYSHHPRSSIRTNPLPANELQEYHHTRCHVDERYPYVRNVRSLYIRAASGMGAGHFNRKHHPKNSCMRNIIFEARAFIKCLAFNIRDFT
jgi:hypothetical protein